eukprot:TRINITY_DN15084_c0_g4_i2.p1 TRINITY_DN15084_c0_g4~~TRINITY_DN15084_c0_g4_i2.p1  ORF type:complete len:286 (-),score=64.27 TRINITY_DN15084_c0_g4_i2:137-994(-)
MSNDKSWTKFKQARYFHKLARGQLLKANEEELQNSLEQVIYFSENELSSDIGRSKKRVNKGVSRGVKRNYWRENTEKLCSLTVIKKPKKTSFKKFIEKIDSQNTSRLSSKQIVKKPERNTRQRVTKTTKEKLFNKTFICAKTATAKTQSNRLSLVNDTTKDTFNHRQKRVSSSVERKQKQTITSKEPMNSIRKQIKPSPSKSTHESKASNTRRMEVSKNEKGARKGRTPVRPAKTIQPRQKATDFKADKRKSIPARGTYSVRQGFDTDATIDCLLNRLENFACEI